MLAAKKMWMESCGGLQGFLQKMRCRTWCFGGEFVVVCVVKRGG
jgi:hypothetical protein